MFGRSKSENGKTHRSHLKNLMVLAMADGHMAIGEEHLLIAIAHRLGLNEVDIEDIKQNLDNIDFLLPRLYDDRIEQLNDLFTLMSVDGHIDEEELEMCRKLGRRYELPDQSIEEMLQRFI